LKNNTIAIGEEKEKPHNINIDLNEASDFDKIDESISKSKKR